MESTSHAPAQAGNPPTVADDAGATDSQGRTLPLLGRRRTLLINPEFQLRALALPTLISVGTVTALIFTLFRVLVTSSFPAPQRINSLWETQEVRWLLMSFAAAAGFTALMLIVGLVETHRAAGAIFKVKRHLVRIGRGDLTTRVHLRRQDHFQDVAEEFNLMAETLQEESRDELHLIQDGLEAVGQVRPAGDDETSRRLAAAWDALVELKHRREKAVG